MRSPKVTKPLRVPGAHSAPESWLPARALGARLVRVCVALLNEHAHRNGLKRFPFLLLLKFHSGVLWLESFAKTEGVPWSVWLSWLERPPHTPKVCGLMPRRGTYLGCPFIPSPEHGNQCFSFPSPFSKAMKKCPQVRIKTKSRGMPKGTEGAPRGWGAVVQGSPESPHPPVNPKLNLAPLVHNHALEQLPSPGP